MSSVRSPSTLLLLLLLLITNKVFAGDPVQITFSYIPDPDNGRDIFETCAACHLPEGWGNIDGAYPPIAGQHINVLLKQLLDIRTGLRENPTMYPFVQQRTIGGYKDMADVVVYISKLPMHPRHQQGPWYKGSPEYKSGETLYQQHCSHCHGQGGEGNNESFIPQLYGQHYSYMLRQLSQIKKGLRVVNPSMKAIVDNLDQEQVKKVLNYVSMLPVPENKLAPSLNWRNKDYY